MSIPIHVDANSGYKANERPRQFTLDEVVYEIAAVVDQWYEPSATYFKVQTTEGKTYLLRYDEETDEWTLQSGFDGMSCCRDQVLHWSQPMLRLQRKQNGKSTHASTVIQPMRRFRSTGF